MRIWALISFCLILSSNAWAFPELTRHGYTQCTACHFSPSGGGLLTPYGRQLAAELLSTWSYKNEGRILHGLTENDLSERGVHLGGDVRAIQVHKKNKQFKYGRLFVMQADFEVAYAQGPVVAAVSVGEIENPTAERFEGNLNATSYYGLLNFSDHVALRAGRFLPQYGLNLPDHTVGIRSGLGFTPGYMLDTLELSYLGEHWTGFAAQARSLPSVGPEAAELVRSAHLAYAFKGRYKLGFSHLYSEKGRQSIDRLYGLNAILGFSERFFSLLEIDTIHGTVKDSVFGYARWGYEVVRGVVPYLQYERQHADLRVTDGAANHYIAGFNFFPRPHFELSGQWARVRSTGAWGDQAYLMLHYYF